MNPYALVILIIFFGIFQQFSFLDYSLSKNKVDNSVYIQVYGQSMEPVLKQGSVYKAHPVESLKRNDLVVFDILGSEDPFIKWLAGGPGDKVSFDKSQMLVNGTVAANYSCKGRVSRICNQLDELCGEGYTECTIPPGNCFVLANQKGAQDSLTFGFIQCSKIKYVIDK